MHNHREAREASEATKLTLVLPILPGQSEPYRRFLQELKESRYADFRAACGRWGIRSAKVWLAPAPPTAGPGAGDLSVIQLCPTGNCADIGERFGRSQLPFDLWFKERVRELHGVEGYMGFARNRAELLEVW